MKLTLSDLSKDPSSPFKVCTAIRPGWQPASAGSRRQCAESASPLAKSHCTDTDGTIRLSGRFWSGLLQKMPPAGCSTPEMPLLRAATPLELTRTASRAFGAAAGVARAEPHSSWLQDLAHVLPGPISAAHVGCAAQAEYRAPVAGAPRNSRRSPAQSLGTLAVQTE